MPTVCCSSAWKGMIRSLKPGQIAPIAVFQKSKLTPFFIFSPPVCPAKYEWSILFRPESTKAFVTDGGRDFAHFERFGIDGRVFFDYLFAVGFCLAGPHKFPLLADVSTRLGAVEVFEVDGIEGAT